MSILGGLYQGASTAWARRRYREAFDGVSSFCLFVGYPRSGHSIVGAMLNAHRHAVIAHELEVAPLVLAGHDRDAIYARILGRAAWFHLRGDTSNYRYRVPNQWQGRFERLRVVGDKRGGSAALALDEHPDLLDRIRATTGVPLRLVHVVRNPFDNIAAISLWHRLPLDQATDYYFRLARVTAQLAVPEQADVLTLHHEEVVRDPEGSLALLCRYLALETDAGYLTDCGSIVAAAPSHARRRVPWTNGQIAEVARRAERIPFLARYGFEIEEGATPRRSGVARTPPAPETALWPRLVLRWFPTERTPPAYAGAAAPPARTRSAARDLSGYWDGAARRARLARPVRGWHEYMRSVYRRLIVDWLPAAPAGHRLKTDLFEEAVSSAHPLAELGAGGFGVDISLEIALRARARLRERAGTPCVVADLRVLPLRDGALQGVLSGSSLDHFPTRADLHAGLAELARVLAPGGTLVLTLDNPHNPVVWVRNHLPARLLEATGVVPYYMGTTLGRAETARVLRAAGLDVVESGAVAHAPRLPAIWAARLLERLGARADPLSRALAAFERLARWPTRFRTGYYLAFRAVRAGRAPSRELADPSGRRPVARSAS